MGPKSTKTRSRPGKCTHDHDDIFPYKEEMIEGTLKKVRNFIMPSVPSVVTNLLPSKGIKLL